MRWIGLNTSKRMQIIFDIFTKFKMTPQTYPKSRLRSATQFVLDISKTKSELGYEPRYDWKAFCKWFKKERKEQRFAKLWGKECDNEIL